MPIIESALLAVPILVVLFSSIILPVTANASGGGSGAVSLEKVSTGSSNLNHDITDFYKCISDTHKDPPSLSVIHQCYSDNVQGDSSSSSSFSSSPGTLSEIPIIIQHHHHSIIIEGFNH